jgi:predicted secreted protein
MATGSKLGYGSLLKRGNGASPQTFVTVIEITGISEFGSEAALVDVSNFDSPGGYREYILGLKDPVEISVTGNFRPDSTTQSAYDGLQYDHNSSVIRDFKLVLTTSLGTYNFSALVKGFKASVPVDGVIGVTFTLKPSGAITYQH